MWRSREERGGNETPLFGGRKKQIFAHTRFYLIGLRHFSKARSQGEKPKRVPLGSPSPSRCPTQESPLVTRNAAECPGGQAAPQPGLGSLLPPCHGVVNATFREPGPEHSENKMFWLEHTVQRYITQMQDL